MAIMAATDPCSRGLKQEVYISFHAIPHCDYLWGLEVFRYLHVLQRGCRLSFRHCVTTGRNFVFLTDSAGLV